jgi:integrase/recombinase XerD
MYTFVYTLGMALILYRRHLKACSKGYEQNHRVFQPGTPKEIKADCECPIVCSGTTPSQPKKLRHMSLDTNDWDNARNTVKLLEEGRLIDPETQTKGITVERAVKKFLAYKGPEGQNIDSFTYGKYRVMLEGRIQPFCIAHKLDGIEAFNVSEVVIDCFLAFRSEKPNKGEKPLLGEGTKKSELIRYRSFLRFCVGHGWLSENHATKIRLGYHKPEPKYGLEPEEESQVFNAIGDNAELRALILVMRNTGLRISDAVKLDHTQLVPRASGKGFAVKVASMQKTKEWVYIPITMETAEALQKLSFKGEKHGRKYWFYTGLGKTRTSIKNWRERVDKLLKFAQVEKPFLHHATPHTLRHTFAISALNNETDIKTVSRWLGHANTKITEASYAHANRATLRSSEEAYDRAMARAEEARRLSA